MWDGMDLLIGCSSSVQSSFTSGSTTFSDAAQSEEGNPVIGCESLCCRCYIASGEVNVRRQFLFGSAAIWLEVRLLLVDTSAAWNKTISTKLMQRNDECPACFAACAGEKSNVVISPTLSLSPTSSSCRKWTTFLHCESARDCSNVYFVNGAVFCPPQL